MSVVSRTISYLKRNGLRNTVSAVLERVDGTGMDPLQQKANRYTGGDDETQKAHRPPRTQEICFSIVVPAYETRECFLRELIESVLGQTYRNLELVIADASASDHVERVVAGYGDGRILYRRLKENRGISENTNCAIALATGDYIGLLDHDDVLAQDALSHIAALIMEQGCDMVYTDEDKMSTDGTRFFEPNYKPDFNLDYLLTNNYICHFTVIRAGIIKALQCRSDYDGAQDYDLFLRTVAIIMKRAGAEDGIVPPTALLREKIGHVNRILYHWRAHENSTADNPESKRYAYEAGKRALEDFLAQEGWHALVTHSTHLGFYEVTYLPDIFSVREDIAAVGTYRKTHGKVTEGPALDGEQCFLGMRTMYSGYLHRADLMFEADHLPAGRVLKRGGQVLQKENGEGAPDEACSGRMLYVSPQKFDALQKTSADHTPS